MTTRRTGGHFNHDNPDQYDGGKLSSFSYDPLDRETQAVITPDQGDPHTVDTSWYPSGQRSAQTTHQLGRPDALQPEVVDFPRFHGHA